MSADASYLAPGSYPLAWPILGGLLLLALLIWWLVVFVLTRPPADDAGAPLPPSALARQRAEALARIDEVEQSVTSGARSARAGHHELSTITRGFVAAATGLDADKMTADDLRRRGPEHVARLIETYYPRQFGVAEAERPAIRPAAAAAREVVGGWS